MAAMHHGKIERVPPLLLDEEKNKNEYYPKVVSIGPYHHGHPKLAAVQAFKPIAVDLFIDKAKAFYYNQILEIIRDVRNCYEQDSVAQITDSYLAEMMLCDAALLVIAMEIAAPAPTPTPDLSIPRKAGALFGQLGKLTVATLTRDFFLLENQIPLRVVKLLISLRYGAGEDEKLLHRYMTKVIFTDSRQRRADDSTQEPPLHLLEAFHRLVAPQDRSSGDKKERDPEIGVGPPRKGNEGWKVGLAKLLTCCKEAKKSKTVKYIHSFRSVTDLKAKGIHFRPSPTKSLKDANFKSGFFYARLELPEWVVSINTKVFFLNLLAYEWSPGSKTTAVVAAYLDLMKSLIDCPGDVKELRERKIFYNRLGSDEEVFNVYKDISIYGACNPQLFSRVRDDIQAHYNSRVKTWIAELIHTNFRSPWTITAFLAAVALLAISAAQLYYAVNPK